jgi:hypothetical protein
MYSQYTTSEFEVFRNIYPINKQTDEATLIIYDFLDFYTFRSSNSTHFIKDYYNKIQEKVIEIYGDFGCPVETVDTEIIINNTQLNSIKKILGEVIYDKDLTIKLSIQDTVEDEDNQKKKIESIKQDIYTIINYDKLINKNNLKNTKILNEDLKPSTETINKNNTNNITNNNIEPFSLNDSYTYIDEIKTDNDTDKMNIIVLYNKNINAFYVCKCESGFIQDICKEFTEFRLMGFFEMVDSLYNDIHNIFHKKFYPLDVAEKKFNSYVYLYNLNNLVNTEKENKTQKNENEDNVIKLKADFKKVLYKNFELSSDPKNKMKANDLYKLLFQLIKNTYTNPNYCCYEIYNSNITDINRNLSCFLIEEGLIKKRYSDGFYYYGIKQVEKIEQKGIMIEKINTEFKLLKQSPLPQILYTNLYSVAKERNEEICISSPDTLWSRNTKPPVRIG